MDKAAISTAPEKEFNLDPGICHLNHAAVAPWPLRTVQAVTAFCEENAATGSQRYAQWLNIEQQLRDRLAQLINAQSSDEIALLKSTSEALSVVAWGLDWKPGDEVLISTQEFPSNRIVWESLKPLGVTVRQIETDVANTSPAQQLVDAMSEQTRLVSVSSVQYATGLALDLATIGRACRERDIVFCVDAIQSIGALPFDVQACHADFVMADGHKWMLGPEGLALFYCRQAWLERLTLRQFGWHMVEAMGDYDRVDWEPAQTARRFECGSPNMLGIHALHASIGLLLETGMEKISNLISVKVSYLIDNLINKGAIILSETRPGQRAGIVTFRFPDEDTGKRYQYLQKQGVICALRGGGIRFSPHFYTPQAVLDRALELACQPL
ncbi:selenocysteine lyase/cysteine desulfurase [Thiogranum longum]|uniref:Selenocysteine lyase/cysteine desulfurase n=1 Tax=Thiogranum longum TaxID=1537524 RepID=A0A4R1HCN8_9GAMM|nr:aminotransferase class V-fold PLP-dependent enzyme [Thiogranum longum]TCK18323.1 selenocysteine lyase/cysteine desulfurase [Thiogranum longum]